MKVMLLAVLLAFSSCFTPSYPRERYSVRWGDRTDRYYNTYDYDRYGRARPASAHRGKMIRKLPRHAQIERRGGETYAWTRSGVFVWDGYRRGWVMIR